MIKNQPHISAQQVILAHFLYMGLTIYLVLPNTAFAQTLRPEPTSLPAGTKKQKVLKIKEKVRQDVLKSMEKSRKEFSQLELKIKLNILNSQVRRMYHRVNSTHPTSVKDMLTFTKLTEEHIIDDWGNQILGRMTRQSSTICRSRGSSRCSV